MKGDYFKGCGYPEEPFLRLICYPEEPCQGVPMYHLLSGGTYCQGVPLDYSLSGGTICLALQFSKVK